MKIKGNLNLTGDEAQYAMRYLRYLAGWRKAAGSTAKNRHKTPLVPNAVRQSQIENLVDRLVTEATARAHLADLEEWQEQHPMGETGERNL